MSILCERRYKTIGQVYNCDGGPLGSLTLPEAFTDRGVLPAARPVTVDGLVDLARVMAALRNGLTESEE